MVAKFEGMCIMCMCISVNISFKYLYSTVFKSSACHHVIKITCKVQEKEKEEIGIDQEESKNENQMWSTC